MIILRKNYFCVFLFMVLCFCGCSEDNLSGDYVRGNDANMIVQKEDSSIKEHSIEDVQINAPDLEKCEKLSTALDMLIVYGVRYDESMEYPDKDFWEGFLSALVCNSWFDPFYDENHTDRTWDNERIAATGSLIVGRELTCTFFPNGIDGSNTYSPYLAWSSKVNVHTKPLGENKFEISYDMMWAPVSMTSIDGMIRVSAIVEENKDSPLDGYSIVELEHEEIFECVYMVYGEFDYEVSADNDEIKKCLYQMTDGVHITMNNENLSKLLNNADDLEYVFADINGDLTDEMIIRTNGHDYNFFFYTDEGILGTTLPMSSDFEIWFAEDYLVVGKDSKSTEERYTAYQIGSDGTFKQVMLLKNKRKEDTERFFYVTEQGEEREITEEEYKYLGLYLKSKESKVAWSEIP